MQKQQKLPLILLIFTYLTPIVCIILVFFGVKHQIIHPLYIWLSLIIMFTSAVLFPFLKRKMLWAKNLIMGLCLLFAVILISPSIELPLLLVLPILPGLKIYLFLMLVYFSYFFTVFLSNTDILEYFSIISKHEGEEREKTLSKYKKWRKMFGISAASIIVIFSATGILMTSSSKLNYKEIGEVKQKQYILNKLKSLQEQSRTQNNSPISSTKKLKFEKISFNKIKFKIPQKFVKKTNKRKILFQRNKKTSSLILSLELRPYYSDNHVFLKQIALMRYISLAKNSFKNINAKLFLSKKGHGGGTYITSKNHKEAILLYKTHKGAFLFYFLITKENVKYIETVLKTLDVSKIIN